MNPVLFLETFLFVFNEINFHETKAIACADHSLKSKLKISKIALEEEEDIHIHVYNRKTLNGGVCSNCSLRFESKHPDNSPPPPPQIEVLYPKHEGIKKEEEEEEEEERKKNRKGNWTGENPIHC